MPISPPCRGLAQQLDTARKSLAKLQSSPTYLDHGKPNPGSLREAQQLEAKIATLSGQLDACVRAHPFHPFVDPCQAKVDAVVAAQKILANIFSSPNYLDHGKPNPGSLREAKEQEAKIRSLEAAYDDCLRKHGLLPDEICSMSGHAHFASSAGSGGANLTVSVLFKKYHHKALLIYPFVPFTIPAGPVDATVSMVGGGEGNFDPTTGELDASLSLFIDATDPGGSATVFLPFSTAGAGSPMDSEGNLTLVGSATAVGSGIGVPDQVQVTMTFVGKVSPRP